MPSAGDRGAPDASKFPKLPAAPLVKAVYGARLPKETTLSVCKRAGISERVAREWHTGVVATVAFNTADKVLCRLGLIWWDVWNEGSTDAEGLELARYAFTGEGRDEQLRLVA